MADSEVTILAQIRDQASGPLGKIAASIGSLKGSLDKAKSALSPVTSGITGLVAGLISLQAANSSINAAAEAAEAEQRLLTALKGRRDILAQIKDLTAQIQSQTTFGDDALNLVAAQLLNAGVALSDLNRFLQITVDVSAASGVGLSNVARGLAALNAGESAGSLAKIVPELKDLLRESEDGAEGLRLLELRFKGAAEAAASTEFGKVKQQTELLGDEQERLGAVLVKVKLAILTGLVPAFRSLADFFNSNIGQDAVSAFSQLLSFVLQFAPIIIGVIAAAKAFSFVAWIAGIASALAPVIAIAAVLGLIIGLLGKVGVSWDSISDIISVVVEYVQDIGRQFFNGAASAEDFFDVLSTRAKQAGNIFLQYVLYPISAFLKGLGNALLNLGRLSIAGLKIAFFGLIAGIGKGFEKLVGSVASAIDFITNKTADLLQKIPGIGEDVANKLRTTFAASAIKIDVGQESLREALDDADRAGQAFIDAFPDAFAALAQEQAVLATENDKLESELDARFAERQKQRKEKAEAEAKDRTKFELDAAAATASQVADLEKRAADAQRGRDEASLKRRSENRLKELDRALAAELITFDQYLSERSELELAPLDDIIDKRKKTLEALEKEKAALVANKAELLDILSVTRKIEDVSIKLAEDVDTRAAKESALTDLRLANEKRVLEAARESLSDLIVEAEKARDAYDARLAKTRDRVNNGFLFPSEGTEADAQALARLTTQLDSYDARIDELLTKHPELEDQLIDLEFRMSLLRGTAKETEQSFADFERGFTAGARNVITEGANLRTAGMELGRTFTNDLAGAAVDAITETDFSFASFAANFLKLIAKMILQLVIFRSLAGAFGLTIGANKGGLIPRFASGGPVGGPRINADIIDAKLTPGEFVHRREAVDYYGANVMYALNRMLIPKTAFDGIASFGSIGGSHLNGGGSVAGSGGGGLPTLVADNQTMDRLLAGGATALLRWVRSNAGAFRGALQG